MKKKCCSLLCTSNFPFFIKTRLAMFSQVCNEGVILLFKNKEKLSHMILLKIAIFG